MSPRIPDILLLQETWLSSKSLPPRLDGYRVFRRDRDGDARGGGVLIFVRTSLLATEIPPPDIDADSSLDCVAVEITRIGLPPLRVYNVYRPPRKEGRDLCMEPFPMDDHVVIAGDLNVHHPDWSRGAENTGGKILRDWLVEASAMTLNDPSVSTMAYRPHARYSSPDVVISTPTSNIRNWRVLDSWGTTRDHLPMAFEVPRGYSQPRVLRKTWFSWARADWDGMMEHLDEESSALLANRPATNVQFAKRVASTFRRAVHQFVPRYRQGRPYKEWWTPGLSALERVKGAAFTDLLADPDAPHAQRAYSDAVARFASAATQAKAAHWNAFSGRINRCTDIGLLFRLIRKIDGRTQQNNIPPIRLGHSYYVAADGKTELFGDHLKRVCGGSTATKPPPWFPAKEPSNDDAGCGLITADELDRALDNLDPKTSLDPDGLCSEFLRRLTDGARALILELVNISWEEGFVPESWRDAHVVPVPKPGRDHSLPEGYRPISLTSVISKVMEVIVKNRLEYLTESPQHPEVRRFNSRQGGFRKGRGPEEQLFSIVSALDSARNRLLFTCLLSFDLANAFDTVDHGKLMDILQRRGVPAKFLRWIEAFLRNRRAAYKIDGATGRSFDLNTGVPQGTVLGPLLFLYYIDDLGSDLDRLQRRIHQDNVGATITFSLYADDDGVAVEARTFAALEQYAQDVVDVVERWTAQALMSLSVLKTRGVFFVGKNAAPFPPPNVVFKATRADVPVPPADTERRVSAEGRLVGTNTPHDGKTFVGIAFGPVTEANAGLTLLHSVVTLQWVDKVKLLGLTIDQGFTFLPHLQRVVDGFSLRMNLLRHLAGKDYGFNGTVLRTLYLSYVLPTYTYALGIYGPFILPANGPLTTLERMHRRALTLILGCRKGVAEFAGQQETGILPIRALAKCRIAALREKVEFNKVLWAHELSLDTLLKSTSDNIRKKAGTDGCRRELRDFHLFAPWVPRPDVEIYTSLKVRKHASNAEKKQAVLKRLAELPHPDCVAWPDGSVVHGDPPLPSICDANASAALRPWLRSTADRTTWGAAGVFIDLGPSVTIKPDHGLPVKPTGDRRTFDASLPAGKHPHSYRAEEFALYSCLKFLLRLLPPTPTPLNILVLSDSQSLLMTLSHGPHCQTQPYPIAIWLHLAELESLGYTVTLQFVFGHCGLEGNERADKTAKRGALAFMRAATDAAAKNQPPPLSARLCATAANGRYRSVLWLESSEAGARDALDRATLLRNPSSFARLVFGRRIPRPKHLAPRAEREVRQLRTGHHHLVMTMYATEWRDLSRADRRQAFLPCPICGTRSLAPLLHLFVGCDAPAAALSRLTMDADLDAKSRLHAKPPPVDAMERLWAILFVFPELALAYLQRCGTLPSYAILAGQASGEPVGGGANRSITPDAASSRSADSEDAISR
ncbi:putative RNA-directed DNA polymerase from transposon X-element [Diplonema papillatum]|nr:putative RNA-directed DNA polymerase from transposon X-element [Diplonema papillatum]